MSNPVVYRSTINGEDTSMAKSRRKEFQGWSEREGEGFVQRGQPRQARSEAPATRGRFPARFFLREDDGDEKEVDLGKDGKGSEQSDQQKPSGVEMLGD